MTIEELKRKAAAGSVLCQTILGVYFLEGHPEVGGIDYGEAFRLLSSAANRGGSRAMLNLAAMHMAGMGIPKDVPEAIRLYERAAEKGEFLAQIELARIYSQGLGVPPNPEAAGKWYSAAVDQEPRVDPGCSELIEAKAYLSGLGSKHEPDPGL